MLSLQSTEDKRGCYLCRSCSSRERQLSLAKAACRRDDLSRDVRGIRAPRGSIAAGTRGRIWLCRGFYTVCNGSEEYREGEAACLESGASWASRDSGYTNGVLLYCS